MPINPATVLSPRSRLDPPLTVVHETAHWSLATATWDGNRALLIRWNGDDDHRLGNPVSHGNPTLFVLPDDLHWAVLSTAGPERRREAVNWLAGGTN